MSIILIKLAKTFYEITTSIIIVIVTASTLPTTMTLTGDIFTRYRFKISEFYKKTTEYRDILDLIIKVRTYIYFIIVVTNITYIYNQIIKHDIFRVF